MIEEIQRDENEYIYFQEQWRQISLGIPEVKDRYFISDYARVYNSESDKMMCPRINKFGYVEIHLVLKNGKTKSYKLHRVVMLCFNYIEGCEYLDVNHIDGVKTNNLLWNLEWATRKENMQHAIRHGLRDSCILENAPKAILTNEQVHTICQCLEQRIPYEQIANIINIDYNPNTLSLISDIKEGKSWTPISSQYNIPITNKNNQIFNNDEIEQICQLIKEGYSYEEILRMFPHIHYDELNETRKASMRNLLSKIKLKKRFVNIGNKYF